MSFRVLGDAQSADALIADLLERIRRLEGGIATYPSPSSVGTSDHGALTGTDDPTDHPWAVPYSLVDSKGDVLVALTDNQIAALGVGTDGQVLTADSAQTLGVRWATPTTSSTTPPTTSLSLFTDCTNSGMNGEDFQATGTVSTIPAVASRPGILSLSTGGSATGVSKIWTPLASTSCPIHLGADAARLTTWLRVSANLSSAAQTFHVVAGFTNVASNNYTSGSGLFWYYTNGVNSGRWAAAKVVAGINSFIDSGTAVVADTWYRLDVEIDAALSAAVFKLNNTTVGTHNSGMPAAGTYTAFVGIYKTFGNTARLIHVDAVWVNVTFSVART